MGGVRGSDARPGGDRVAGFPLLARSGDPTELVSPAPPADGRRVAVLVRPDRPALVVGSAQRLDVADTTRLSAAGWALVRRRSGGGPLVVAPGAQVWLDVFVPPADPLADADISRSSRWLGELWVEALRAEGLVGALVVHGGPLSGGTFARLACFAGLGPGEVSWEGRKIVGVSQRRTRAGSWLHTMALIVNRQPELAELLALREPDRLALAELLATAAAPLGLDGVALEARLGGLLAER